MICEYCQENKTSTKIRIGRDSADRSASDLQHEIDLSMLMMYGFQGLRDRGFEKILKRLNKKTW